MGPQISAKSLFFVLCLFSIFVIYNLDPVDSAVPVNLKRMIQNENIFCELCEGSVGKECLENGCQLCNGYGYACKDINVNREDCPYALARNSTNKFVREAIRCALDMDDNSTCPSGCGWCPGASTCVECTKFSYLANYDDWWSITHQQCDASSVIGCGVAFDAGYPKRLYHPLAANLTVRETHLIGFKVVDTSTDYKFFYNIKLYYPGKVQVMLYNEYQYHLWMEGQDATCINTDCKNFVGSGYGLYDINNPDLSALYFIVQSLAPQIYDLRLKSANTNLKMDTGVEEIEKQVHHQYPKNNQHSNTLMKK